jgi:plastocyanin
VTTTIKSRASRALISSALLLVVVTAGVSQSAQASPKPKSYSISISNFMFSPMKLTVTPGATIKVTNKDTVIHTLTAMGGAFNTGNIAHNQTKSFKAPMKPGTYDYICNIHQYMTGEIVVKKSK